MKEQILLKKLLANGWTQAALAERLSTTQQSISRWASGERQPSGPAKVLIRELAKEAGLVEVRSAPDAPKSNGQFSRAEVVGRIGAGAEIESDVDQSARGSEFARLPLPIRGNPDLICFQVEGDSMFPVYEPGDFVVCHRNQHRPTEWFVGKRAAVRLADGRRYVKTVARGSRRGLYDLESWNARTIEDVQIEWVGQIVGTVAPDQVELVEPKRRVATRKAPASANARRR